ncbi:hypothetical protein HanRHA438_Chr12g0574541 [Helianthus annuus]|nr:hypothetical protein HanRHA438_Chr12g0574541 [Helianthus annuus]
MSKLPKSSLRFSIIIIFIQNNFFVQYSLSFFGFLLSFSSKHLICFILSIKHLDEKGRKSQISGTILAKK